MGSHSRISPFTGRGGTGMMFARSPWRRKSRRATRGLPRNPWPRQRRIEEADDVPFETYRQNYLGQDLLAGPHFLPAS